MMWQQLDDYLEATSFAFAFAATLTAGLLFLNSRQSLGTVAGRGLLALFLGLSLLTAKVGTWLLQLVGLIEIDGLAADVRRMGSMLGVLLIVQGFWLILLRRSPGDTAPDPGHASRMGDEAS